jgi:hypothetical protein
MFFPFVLIYIFITFDRNCCGRRAAVFVVHILPYYKITVEALITAHQRAVFQWIQLLR